MGLNNNLIYQTYQTEPCREGFQVYNGSERLRGGRVGGRAGGQGRARRHAGSRRALTPCRVGGTKEQRGEGVKRRKKENPSCFR